LLGSWNDTPVRRGWTIVSVKDDWKTVFAGL
jgi:hypothetical protein